MRGGKSNKKDKSYSIASRDKKQKRKILPAEENSDQIALDLASTVYWLGNPCSDELCGVSNFIIPGEALVISFCPKIIDAPRTRADGGS